MALYHAEQYVMYAGDNLRLAGAPEQPLREGTPATVSVSTVLATTWVPRNKFLLADSGYLTGDSGWPAGTTLQLGVGYTTSTGTYVDLYEGPPSTPVSHTVVADTAIPAGAEINVTITATHNGRASLGGMYLRT